MQTIQLLVNDRDFRKYLLGRRTVMLSEIREKIKTELFQKAIEKSIKIAREIGLSGMTMEEIDAEISKVRKGA